MQAPARPGNEKARPKPGFSWSAARERAACLISD
jgi:hypothetical protein